MLIEPNPLVEEVIGCAIDVHRALGPGLLESAYASCLCEELDQRRIPFRREVPVPVRYKNRSIECAYRADFVVKDTVVVEVKSIAAFESVHSAQLMTYLRLLNLREGLLLNFNRNLLKDGIKRLLR
jgi:GxxExxY protein